MNGMTSIMVLAWISHVATIARPAAGINFHAFDPFGFFMTITGSGVGLKEIPLKMGVYTCFTFSPSVWHMRTHPREVLSPPCEMFG